MPRRKGPVGLVDYRHQDWSQHDLSIYGDREQRMFRRSIAALEDSAVAEATYQLINFGESHTDRSLSEFAAATWLMDAYTVAVILGKLPEASQGSEAEEGPRKRTPGGLVDYRNADWSEVDLDDWIEQDRERFRRAVDALEDPAVAEATYQLVNFANSYSERSLRDHSASMWLHAAHTAAFVLGKLPPG